MLSEIDNRIAAIKAKLERAQLAKIRNEANRDNLVEAYEKAKAQLKEKYGVDSPEGIRAKLAELQADLDHRTEEINKILDDINL